MHRRRRMVTLRGRHGVGGDDTLAGRCQQDGGQRDGAADGGQPGHGDGRGVRAEPPELRTPPLDEVGRQAGPLGGQAVQRCRDERDRGPHQEGRRDVTAEATGGGRPDDPRDARAVRTGTRRGCRGWRPTTARPRRSWGAEELRLLGEQPLDRGAGDHDRGRLPDHERAERVAPGGTGPAAQERDRPHQAEHGEQRDGGEQEPAELAEQQLATERRRSRPRAAGTGRRRRRAGRRTTGRRRTGRPSAGPGPSGSGRRPRASSAASDGAGSGCRRSTSGTAGP